MADEVAQLARKASVTSMVAPPSEGNPDDAEQAQTRARSYSNVWAKQQQKTFTAWVNASLRKKKEKIDDLATDFQDGLKLMKLLEAISGEKLPKPERVRMKIHKIQNINHALRFIQDKGVRLAGIGAEEICDGNLKLTLGMVWTIILRFQIQNISIEEKSAKEGLLLWCQKKTKEYDNVEVQNFHTSFRDGLAFCALIHKHRPDLIPNYHELRAEDAKSNLELAFKVAEEALDIPAILDAEDIVATPKPDEHSVMAYVSYYYHAFASSARNETAARRINNALVLAQELDALRAEYDEMATSLLAWIAATVARLDADGAAVRSSVAEVEGAQAAFKEYRKGEKPPRSEEKGRLEAHYSALQTKLRVNNRPAWVPGEGRAVQDVNAAWRRLEDAERAHEEKLRAELVRLERLAALAAKFHRKADVLAQWTEGKEALLRDGDVGDSVAAVLTLKQQHAAFEAELASRESRLETLRALGAELEGDHFHDVAGVRERTTAADATWASLVALCAERAQALEDAEARQRALEEQRLAFAKLANSFVAWTENVGEDMQEHIMVHSVAAVEALQRAHGAVKEDVAAHEAAFAELRAAADALEAAGVTSNAFTSYSMAHLAAAWESLAALATQREAALAAEGERQLSNEALRVQFAGAADPLGDWLEAQRLRIAGGPTKGGLEEHKGELASIGGELAARRGEVEAVEQLAQRLEQARVFENPHTRFTMDALTTDLERIHNQLALALQSIDNQILQRDSSGMTDEQIAELRDTFNHFDKDKSGALDRMELRACLMSSGFELPTLEAGDDDPKMDAIMARVDPGDAGTVSFEAYLNFCAQESVDKDTPEQCVESFKVIANDADFITRAQLTRELGAEKAEYAISRMQPAAGEDDAFDYNALVAVLYGQ